MRATWRITGVMLLAGCGGANAGQSDPQACAPVESSAADLAADRMGGTYTVRLVATEGAKRGASTEGTLELLPQDSTYRTMTMSDGMADTSFTMPFYGTTEVDFSAVGAVAPGDPKSADPARPGVLVIDGPERLMLRVGSEANRRDVRRFDGAYTAFQVQQVTDKGFAGTWRSGVGTVESSGHFCADRTT